MPRPRVPSPFSLLSSRPSCDASITERRAVLQMRETERDRIGAGGRRQLAMKDSSANTLE